MNCSAAREQYGTHHFEPTEWYMPELDGAVCKNFRIALHMEI